MIGKEKFIKHLFIVLICTSTYNFIAQNNSRIAYKADGLFMLFNDMNSLEQISEVPYGKDVELTYDVFFKSWTIRFKDKNGNINPIKFEYLKTNEDGSIEMKDSYGNWFTCYNKISTKKELLFVSNKIQNDMINTLKASNVTLTK